MWIVLRIPRKFWTSYLEGVVEKPLKDGGLANLIVTHEDDSYSEIKTLNGREVAADLTSVPHSPFQDINQSEMTDNKLLSLSHYQYNWF